MMRKLIGSRGIRRALALLVLPAIPVVILGVVFSRQTRVWSTERATSNAAMAASLVADMAISPILTPSDFSSPTIDANRTAELNDALGPFVGDSIIRIKIWDDDGRIVYSDEMDTVGRTFAVSHELADALAGEVSSEVSQLNELENSTEEEFDDLLEVYVPLRTDVDGPVVGAFELYLPYDPIDEAIEDESRQFFLMLAAALLLLYVVLAGVLFDRARSGRQADEREYEANHDSLTGLSNRRFFRSRLEGLAARGADDLVAVMIVDLDDFKLINDTHGHTAGDDVLRAVAGRLSGAVRAPATVSRLGGDEFAVVVPFVSDEGEAGAIAERLIEALRAPIRSAEQQFDVRASIGIDVVVARDLDPDTVQRNADDAMYVAKAAGKDQYSLH